MAISFAAAAFGLLMGAAAQCINFIVLKRVFRDFGSGDFAFKRIILLILRVAIAAFTLVLLYRISVTSLVCGAAGYLAMTAVNDVRSNRE